MRVLIVQSDRNLAQLWQQHLECLGAEVMAVQSGTEAIALVEADVFDVLVIDLILIEGSALTVADIALFRRPATNVVFVTNSTFFSDGSIFNHSANARAFIEVSTPPADLAAIVYHYGKVSPDRAERSDQSPD